MNNWVDWLRDVATRQPAALVSILATEGSAPRGAGTRMLVAADACYGTIGGGQLEHRVTEQALAMLGQPAGSWRVQDYPLGPLLGQCCGGRVRLLIEHVHPDGLDWIDAVSEGAVLVSTLTDGRVERAIRGDVRAVPVSARGDRPGTGAVLTEVVGQYRRPLCLFGAGHVGQAIVRHAAMLPFRLAWFDTRPDYEDAGAVTVIAETSLEQCVGEAPADAAILVLTHDHALDYRLVRAALERPPVAFVGLIGSATKRARFLQRLERDGIDATSRARLTCPIGITGVVGKEPGVIAIATLAQLLQLAPA